MRLQATFAITGRSSSTTAPATGFGTIAWTGSKALRTMSLPKKLRPLSAI